MASSIGAARLALYDMLVDATWPTTTPQITFGAPAAYEEAEVVALTGVESESEEPAVIGGSRPRDETFVLVVTCKVHDPAADTGQTVDARGFALMDVVRATVYADPALDGALSAPGWASISSQRSDGAVPAQGERVGTTAGWVLFGEVRIACRARIA